MSETLQKPLSDTHTRFFVTMAVLLLVIAFAGFAPTFYLKMFFDTPELPWYLQVHGATLTTWFPLLLAQTALIATNRPGLRERHDPPRRIWPVPPAHAALRPGLPQ